MNEKSWECLICRSSETVLWEMTVKPQGRYFFCQNCDFIFRSPPEAHLSPEEEKSRYELHENVESEGYRKFFDPLRLKMRHYLKLVENPRVLDFGSGPTEYLANLMRTEDRYEVEAYDPYFCPKPVLHKSFYDAITSTEVFEHFYQPMESISEIGTCLKPQGYLFVLTSPPPLDFELFEKWHYRRDPTHVSFFSEKTMGYLGQVFDLQLSFVEKNLWVFRKNENF